MKGNWLDKPQWVPLRAPFTTGPESRKAQEYVDVCRQFDVEHAWRYLPRSNKTFCNIYVADCTAALGCGIPHWIDEEGKPVRVGEGFEMSANTMHEWLEAKHDGWRKMSREDAKARADLGFPVVVSWRNPLGASGHVAMLLPGFLIAQAGSKNHFMVPLPMGFGTLKPDFFTHD